MTILYIVIFAYTEKQFLRFWISGILFIFIDEHGEGTAIG